METPLEGYVTGIRGRQLCAGVACCEGKFSHPECRCCPPGHPRHPVRSGCSGLRPCGSIHSLPHHFFLASFMTDTHPSPQHATAPDEAAHGIAKGLPDDGDRGFSLFLRRAFSKGAGYTDAALGRPIIGIANTASAYNPCHGNAPQLIEAVQRGVLLAGGLPMDFPTISVHESFSQPTSMYLRNLMSMDTEEMVRAQPMDAVVLIGGCDKTLPPQLIAAASAGLPSIQLITGSMLTGSHRGERVGACTDCRRYWGKYRAGEIDIEETADVNNQLVASVGTCSVMATASTMACIAEALGMTMPGGASPPAVTADRIRVAEQTGAQAVQIARERLSIDKVLTPAA